MREQIKAEPIGFIAALIAIIGLIISIWQTSISKDVSERDFAEIGFVAVLDNKGDLLLFQQGGDIQSISRVSIVAHVQNLKKTEIPPKKIEKFETEILPILTNQKLEKGNYKIPLIENLICAKAMIDCSEFSVRKIEIFILIEDRRISVPVRI